MTVRKEYQKPKRSAGQDRAVKLLENGVIDPAMAAVMSEIQSSIGQGGEGELENPKWELYARYQATGYTKTTSYLMAYGTGVKFPAVSASKLEAQQPAIRERIKQIKDEIDHQLITWVPSMSLARWEELHRAAKDKGDLKSMIMIQDKIDKLTGVLEGAEKSRAKESRSITSMGDAGGWTEDAQRLMGMIEKGGS